MRNPRKLSSQFELLPTMKAGGGLLSERLAQLGEFPAFGKVAAKVDVSGDPTRFLSDLTATFARVYLTNANDSLSTFAFIHSVTGPNAVRLMAPYLSDATMRAAMRSAWQVSAALYAAFGSNRNLARTIETCDITPEELTERAIANGDEHAIKMTEACLREFALNPDPAFLAAAENAIDRL